MRSHRLLSTVILSTLALTAVVTAPAHSQSQNTTPYIYSTDTFPPYRATVARHTLRLAIPTNSQAVSALKLTAPAGFTLNQRVEVFNHRTGEKLPININLVGGAAPVEHRQTVELSFDRAIAPGTAINIELNNVRVWGLEKYYDLAVKFAPDNRTASESKVEIPSSNFVNLGRVGLRS
jgi:Protein of unknown function (DUF2808)